MHQIVLSRTASQHSIQLGMPTTNLSKKQTLLATVHYAAPKLVKLSARTNKQNSATCCTKTCQALPSSPEPPTGWPTTTPAPVPGLTEGVALTSILPRRHDTTARRPTRQTARACGCHSSPDQLWWLCKT
mmetsp:Transcript_58231/g.115418  ORF Transcript_58231/g.115418 Transcript_58231/m.115418 type:complete len:130 (-) Transcript_58231:1474-1863(-)